MSIITRMLKQTCVYWALAYADSGGDDYDDYGQPQYASPVELSCRWEDAGEEFIAADGSTQISRSVVYVESDVEVGGVLMLGEIADIENSSDIKENDGAWEIRRFEKTPNFKATEWLRVAFL